METANSMTAQEAKWVAGRNNKDQREARLAELRASISELESEYQKIKTVAPEAQGLVDQWTGCITELRKQFVHEIRVRAMQGKTPVIRFESPEAQAYLNADRWISVFPVLAEEATGSRGISSDNRALQVQIINDELSVLRAEYSALGGV